ncbi:lipopolysaccharide assembly protein LapA domain-containing protein [Pseudomonas sp. SDO524_S393]
MLTVLVLFLENQQVVTLSFLGWNTAHLPVALPLIMALLIGMVISPSLGLFVRLVGRSGASGRSKL